MTNAKNDQPVRKQLIGLLAGAMLLISCSASGTTAGRQQTTPTTEIKTTTTVKWASYTSKSPIWKSDPSPESAKAYIDDIGGCHNAMSQAHYDAVTNRRSWAKKLLPHLESHCGPIPTTTTRRAVTTTVARSLQCASDAADIENTTRLVGLELDWFAQSAAVADVAGAQLHYDNATFLGEIAIDKVDTFLSECNSYARSAGTYNELQQASATSKSTLAEMRRTCRADLAAFGFDC